jgi:DmsE family decaheme c-type cytochrome
MGTSIASIRTPRWLAAAAALLVVFTLPAGAQDAAAPAPSPAVQAVRTCTRCHDETDRTPVLSILKSKHAVMADPRTPFADQACVNCHGASTDHMKAPAAEGARRIAPDRVFGDDPDSSPARVQNGACLGCHENGLRMHWAGSTHQLQDVACSGCHRVHAGEDPVLATPTQPEVCFGCHRDKRAEMHRPSTHPVLAGQMGCADCHNPHGTTSASLLAGSTVNETCYKCHADKRGPFLWEHAPVREDCTNCHKPHGSNQPSLLKARVPWLCQQCHLAPFHPSTAYSGTGLPGVPPSGAQQMLGKSCMNCHSQVHGSNHPSGPRKTR